MSRKILAIGKWKKLDVKEDSGHFKILPGHFEDLVEIQELTDYSIITNDANVDKKIKKRKLDIPDSREVTKKKKKEKKSDDLKNKKNKIIIEIYSEENEKNSIEERKKKKKLIKKSNSEKYSKIKIKKELTNIKSEEEKNLNDFTIVEDKKLDEDDNLNDLTIIKQTLNHTKIKLITHSGKVIKGKYKDVSKKCIKQMKIAMSKWEGLFVCKEILMSLYEQNFVHPTAIQVQALPHAVRDRMDIIGAAETGSGKTLAFAIPILTWLCESIKKKSKKRFYKTNSENNVEMSSIDGTNMDEKNIYGTKMEANIFFGTNVGVNMDDGSNIDGVSNNENVDKKNEDNEKMEISIDQTTPISALNSKALYSLILTPTRELAFQIRDHINMAAKYINIRCVALVGGMSIDKQVRMLKQQPEIVIATPGRLWQLIEQRNNHLMKLPAIRFLVVDEADRMVEKNHFEELTNIFAFLNQTPNNNRQNFIFSATLTFVHPKPFRRMNAVLRKKNNKAFKTVTVDDKLAELSQKIGLRPKYKLVDLTNTQQPNNSNNNNKNTNNNNNNNNNNNSINPSNAAVLINPKIAESKILCPIKEKDHFLFYLLYFQSVGRTILFANSKDCIRRLSSLLTVLGSRPLTLHADMHQKQRLKNLDKFRTEENGLLLATDVAARGLDIPKVQRVIHYQVPKTIENYVHRSGRTARSFETGSSVLMACPEEHKEINKIIHTIKQGKDIDNFEIDRRKLEDIKLVVQLARDIETQEHRLSKAKANLDWMKQASLDADIEYESDGSYGDADIDKQEDVLELSMIRQKIKQQRLQLASLLNLPTNKKKKNRRK